jgi:hypothetical protein
MEALYSFIIVVVLIGQFILGKVLVVGEEDMNDTPMHKQYIIISLILLTPVLLAIWLLDRSQPQPLLALLLAIPFFYRGYMEWRYVNETKRHKVSFILAFILLFFMVLLLVLRLLM